jgi:hypothetical protein
LRSLLDSLGVPIQSQLLVYSQTALHPRLVGPQNPRAVYFNDDVSVAWTPGASTLEVAADDPQKGSLFYLLHQDRTRAVRLERESRCLTCHASAATLQVPTLMLRSFVTDERGRPLSGYGNVSHATEFAKRFGGWYVTGSSGEQPHLGNRIEADWGEQTLDLARECDVSTYLSPHSDLVAHLVLNHQVGGKALLTRVAYEARLGRHSDAEERLIEYLLFAGEAPLPAEVAGTSGYADWFAKQGPFDSRGRSLREFDLQTRLCRYRLSYLIYSAVFEGLPDDVKQHVYQRLWHGLSSPDPPPQFRHLQLAERVAIIEIVRDTKDDLPPEWASARPP